MSQNIMGLSAMTLGISGPPPPFTQRSATSDLTAITFTVADSAPGTTLEVCVTTPSGSAFGPHSGWKVPISPSATTGTYTQVQMLVPTGGPWTVWARDKNNTANAYQCPTTFLVGDVRALIGQSLAVGMWGVSGSPPSPDVRSKMWDASAAAWVMPTGDGLITLLNQLIAETNVPQAVIASAVGATSLTLDGTLDFIEAGYGSSGWWLNPASGSLFSNFSASLTASGGDMSGAILIQGESDVISVRSDTYARGLSELWRRTVALTSRTPPQIRMAIAEVGADFNISNANVAAVIQGQSEAYRLVVGLYRAARHNDAPRDATGVHLTADGYALLGRRLAGAIAREEYGV